MELRIPIQAERSPKLPVRAERSVSAVIALSKCTAFSPEEPVHLTLVARVPPLDYVGIIERYVEEFAEPESTGGVCHAGR